MACYSQLNQIEATSGLHKSAVSHFSSLPAGLKSGAHINTLAFFQKYHRQQDYFLDEAGLQLTVLKQITPLLSAGPAIYYNSFAGMMEKFSLSYLQAGANYNIVITPSVGFSNKENSLISEIYFQIQYSKHLSDKWHLFTSFQGLSNWIRLKSETEFQSHGRSFQYLRIGLAEDHDWQFGLAIDFDQYGPDPIQKTTPGIFLRKVIIHN